MNPALDAVAPVPILRIQDIGCCMPYRQIILPRCGTCRSKVMPIFSATRQNLPTGRPIRIFENLDRPDQEGFFENFNFHAKTISERVKIINEADNAERLARATNHLEPEVQRLTPHQSTSAS